MYDLEDEEFEDQKYGFGSEDAKGARTDSKPVDGCSTQPTPAISQEQWDETHGGMNGVCVR